MKINCKIFFDEKLLPTFKKEIRKIILNDLLNKKYCLVDLKYKNFNDLLFIFGNELKKEFLLNNIENVINNNFVFILYLYIISENENELIIGDLKLTDYLNDDDFKYALFGILNHQKMKILINSKEISLLYLN